MRRLLALALILPASAHAQNEADSQKALQAAQVEMMKCFFGQASVLDDHVSDASTIATGVLSSCAPQFNDWRFAEQGVLQPTYSPTLFYNNMQRIAHDWALEAVLRLRAASKH